VTRSNHSLSSTRRSARSRHERGTALLALMLIGSALTAAAGTLAAAVFESAAELHARSEVLCARYAADGGLVVGPAAQGRPDLISEQVDSLEVQPIRRAENWCVLRSTARCAGAVRSTERTVDCLRFRVPP